MSVGAGLFWCAEVGARELVVFAAVAFVIGGVDELLIDLIWLWRATVRRLTVHRRFGYATAATLPAPQQPGSIAVFVAAWSEGAVIGQMLRNALTSFKHPDFRIYLGCYPNDPGTLEPALAIAATDPRLRLAINGKVGPTTKADALNGCWQLLLEDEKREGRPTKAIVLHDAEDVVHPDELIVFDTLIERFDLVQLPVYPLPDPRSRWVAGTYMDEFAEAHGKTLVVREALGAGVPSAGVGCAVARHVLARVAGQEGGRPFQEDSLTEDYELGLRIAEAGGRGAFVRIHSAPGAGLVAVRAFFPHKLDAAVRQKARWIVGIALAGWDRLGWSGGLAERWMRLRDRRAMLGAIVLLAAYAGLFLQSCLWIASWLTGWQVAGFSNAMLVLVDFNALMLFWRLAMRCAFVRDFYGWREGLIAIPRLCVSNFIAVLSARRAATRYLAMRRAGKVEWDKTEHHFPDVLATEAGL